MRGSVGVFGSTDVIPPAALHIGWGVITSTVVVLAVRRAPRRGQVVVGGLTVLALGLLVSGEGLAIPDTGYWWQGRYVMPFLIGAVVTAGALGSRTVLGRTASLATIGALVALHLWAFLYAARHYAVGYGGTAQPWRFLTDPVWTPPTGPAALWAVVLVGGLAAANLIVLYSVDGAPSRAGLDRRAADGAGDGTVTVDRAAVRRAKAMYRSAPFGVRAFVTARYLIAPLSPLTEEVAGLNGRMLSLGSGFAMIERYLVEVNPDLFIEGIDMDKHKVDLINTIAGADDRIHLRHGDATRLMSETTYDAVLICDALHHFTAESHEPLAREVAATLVPGGVCIIKDLDVQPRWKYWWNRLHDRVVAGPEPLYCRAPDEMARCFQAAGLELERIERTDRPWTPYAHYLLRLRKPAAEAT